MRVYATSERNLPITLFVAFLEITPFVEALVSYTKLNDTSTTTLGYHLLVDDSQPACAGHQCPGNYNIPQFVAYYRMHSG